MPVIAVTALASIGKMDLESIVTKSAAKTPESLAAPVVPVRVIDKLWPVSVIPTKAVAVVSLIVAVIVPVVLSAIVLKSATDTPPLIVNASLPSPVTVPAVPAA